jgi:IS30 family transposase
VSGKRHISERTPAADGRTEFGHREIDKVHGSGRESVVSLGERLTGLVLIDKVPNLSAAARNQRLLRMIRSFEPAHGLSFETITRRQRNGVS